MPKRTLTSTSALNSGFSLISGLMPGAADERLDWRRDAACAEIPQQYVFTRDLAEAEQVLRACNQCPIRRECEAIVDPSHTWFDGVSGGRLWRNGREVKARKAPDSRKQAA
ncbi:WhiB family transcriptional regulator [Streptomyces sp. NBC_01304]|uniref:WhiB family transcriptional regulator n=1 Tax=Streptomyces sp. NBC_01304 TaxID=2903818 RepID=UPI002E127C66|nr:WhiB family transcriptional regulator [Streptomyces sp. NBC_01304]